MEAVANIRYRTTRNEDTRCYFCKNNCLRTFIDVDVTAGHNHDHDHSSAPALAVAETESAKVITQLPSLEHIQANLSAAEDHGSSCGTGSSRGSFKAKVEPLIQIQIAPGSSKVVELPKPVDFQPRKTKVP